MGRPYIDLSGKKFSRLTVLKIVGRTKNGSIIWECKCDCGNTTTVDSGNLIKNRNKRQSCGCWRRERCIRDHLKHGLKKHPLYQVWRGMKLRCRNSRHYSKIKVCKEWDRSFKKFYDFCIVNGWECGLQIDRKNNNGDYHPDNVRFVTNIKNYQNRRTSKIWIIFGIKFNAAREAAEFHNVSISTIFNWCYERKDLENCYSYLKY